MHNFANFPQAALVMIRLLLVLSSSFQDHSYQEEYRKKHVANIITTRAIASNVVQ